MISFKTSEYGQHDALLSQVKVASTSPLSKLRSGEVGDARLAEVVEQGSGGVEMDVVEELVQAHGVVGNIEKVPILPDVRVQRPISVP